jgi:hypothetical protein
MVSIIGLGCMGGSGLSTRLLHKLQLHQSAPQPFPYKRGEVFYFSDQMKMRANAIEAAHSSPV